MRSSPTARLVPLLLVLAARAASAQAPTPPPDPLDSATIRFGPLGLNPALIVRNIGRDTNVFNDATGAKSDFTATITPKLDVLLHPGPMNLLFTTTSDYVYYQTYTSERGTNLGTSLRVDFDFGAFKPYVSTGHVNTRERLNREIDTRARRQDQSYGGGIRVQLFEGVFATADARQSKTAYDPNAVFRGQTLETTLNETYESLAAGGGVALTPLTSLQVTVSRERARFEFTSDRDSETWRITPTLTFSPLAMLNGTASFGYRRFTTHSALVPNYSGFVSVVTLGTTLAQRHHVDTTFARDVQYSYEEGTAEYIETGVTVAWTWQVGGPVDTRIAGGLARLHYRSPTLTAATDDDTARNFEGSLGYRIKQNLRVSLNAEWRGRSSERSADRAYNSRRVYASLTWGKQ